MPPQPVADNWYIANQRYLMDLISQTRQVLERLIEGKEQGQENRDTDIYIEKYPAFAQTPPALEQLCQIFKLSVLEREIVLLCAGMEIDRSWGKLCAKAQGQPQLEYPTFSLALSISSSPYWGALTHDAPLRRWRLIEMGSTNALTISPLRLDEQIVHYLAGLPTVDERLAQMGASPLQIEDLVPSHIAIAKQMATAWVQATQAQRVLPILQLCGTEAVSKKAIAAKTCEILGLTVYSIPTQNLPRDIDQLNIVRCLWEREWLLYRRVILLDCDRTTESADGEKENNINQLLDTLNAPVIISSLERRRAIQSPLLTLDVNHPSPAEQRQVWQTALSEISPTEKGQIDSLVSHFNLSASGIQTVCTAAKGRWNAGEAGEAGEVLNTPHSALSTQHSPLSTFLWDACRSQARPRLDELAQRNV
ncbi:hypothetical protein [Nostoc sp. LEGE 06077]|uniref:hypothetical protein n=1 Tax=Nostoc sp. LEGE 06077 TaxID=915325 RepID=UPI002AD4AE64|nr:hypothetical protein [Nostoc sp. LEGE 06077]